jgi:2-succinyl-5-enolpyruvyl-6-hydroxy-3-cyclohexene-1-carboxylate synthase
VIVRFGALPVSKPLWRYLERHRAARHILVDVGLWRDPSHITAESWHTDPSLFCSALTSALASKSPSAEWGERWRRLNEAARGAIAQKLAGNGEVSECHVFAELSRLLPAGSLLFAGNSMPVRDMDIFFPSTKQAVTFMANRGASGIDGVVSTALGCGAVSPGRLVLVLGDISFYHDMNGLLAARAFGLKATIIVINNNGGGIFSFLPQAAYDDVFERYFATPHGLTFKAAADLYGLEYCLAADCSTFGGAVKKSLSGKGTMLIEVPGDRQMNVKQHRQIQLAVKTAIREVPGRQR